MDRIGIGRFTPCCLILAFMLGAPFTSRAGIIDINGTCEVGCPSSPPVSNGQSQSGSFDFNYTFGDGDTYNISGAYGASYSTVTGSTIYVTPTVIYMGSSPSVGADTITFDLLQGYYDAGPGSWAGTYYETIPLSWNAPAGSTISAQLLYDGESVGLVGPYGPGNYFAQESKSLDFGSLDTSATLSADYNFVFSFAAGTTTGEGGSSTPEPAMAIPCLLCLALAIWHLNRRKRRTIVYNRDVDGLTVREESV
jgi:hypothetical protein